VQPPADAEFDVAPGSGNAPLGLRFLFVSTVPGGRAIPISKRDRSALSRRRLLSYLAVGVLGFAVDFGLLVLLREVFATPIWLAATVAFWSSLAVVFLSNKYVTFGARGAGHRQLARYLTLLGINYLVTLGVIALAERVGVGYQVGKVVAVAMTTAWNYVAYEFWVFRGAPPAAAADG
jgi:putative flippase GtrA